MKTEKRIRDYAYEIFNDWERMPENARVYAAVMLTLDSPHEYYYCDSAAEIVNRFLANAQTWRGSTARRVKAELKVMMKNFYDNLEVNNV